MGFGLMGAGAAVSGLMEGYQRGRKFAMEEEEAEERKKVRGLQMKKAEQDLRKGELDLEESGLRLEDAKFNRSVDDEDRKILERYLPQISPSQAATANPAQAGAMQAPDVPGVPPTTAPAGGISVPGAAPAGAQAQAPARSKFEILREMNTELLNNQLRRKGADRAAILKHALDSARNFSKAEVQTTIDAMQRFEAGIPQDRILSDLASQGIPVQPGTSFAMVKRKDEKTGVEFDDVQINLPGGKSVSRYSLARSVLDPKDLMAHDREMGKLYEDVRHHGAIEAQTQQHYAGIAARDKAQHEERMAELRANTNAHLETIRARNKELDLVKVQKQQGMFQDQISMLYGYKPMDARTRLALEKEGEESLAKAEAREQKQAWGVYMSMAIASLNIDDKTGGYTVTPAEVKSAYENTTDPKMIKTDSDSRKYVMVGKRKVYVPGPPSEATPETPPPRPGVGGPTAAPQGAATAVPGAAPAAAGITPPPSTTRSGVRSASQVSDQELLGALRESGMIGFQSKILGPRPGIRNQSGISEWDAQAEALSARVNDLLARQRQQPR